MLLNRLRGGIKVKRNCTGMSDPNHPVWFPSADFQSAKNLRGNSNELVRRWQPRTEAAKCVVRSFNECKHVVSLLFHSVARNDVVALLAVAHFHVVRYCAISATCPSTVACANDGYTDRICTSICRISSWRGCCCCFMRLLRKSNHMKLFRMMIIVNEMNERWSRAAPARITCARPEIEFEKKLCARMCRRSQLENHNQRRSQFASVRAIAFATSNCIEWAWNNQFMNHRSRNGE